MTSIHLPPTFCFLPLSFLFLFLKKSLQTVLDASLSCRQSPFRMAVPRSNGSAPPEPIKYAYMFETDKSPTMQFDALLRSIARFIVCLGIRPDMAKRDDTANGFRGRSLSLATRMILILLPKSSLRFTKPWVVIMTVRR